MSKKVEYSLEKTKWNLMESDDDDNNKENDDNYSNQLY